jgi:two-component system, cell cycle response regulator
MVGERILIVDDQEGICDLLTTLCRAEGYEPFSVENGRKAFALLESQPFQVAILDLMLPDMHGLDILRHAKDLQPDIEVIILTGHSDLQTAIDALRLGAYDYLEKPLVDLQIIPLTIRRALDRQELTRHNERLVRELRIAHDELERRRRQQFESIRHIGQALTGALQPSQVTQVLVDAVLSAIHCDGAGCLVLPREVDDPPWAVIGAPGGDAAGGLSAEAEQALLLHMIRQLPPSDRPDPAQVVIQRLADVRNKAVGERDEPWQCMEGELLEGHNGLLGAVVVARHGQDPLEEDALSVLAILAAQGSIALQNAHLFARMRELATRDSLTGVYNHGHFFELLAAEISRAERHNQEAVVLMLDVDHANGLKVINDTYGHQAGDRLLRKVAEVLRNNVRKADVVARYGGDEFIVLAPQTGLAQGVDLAARLCATIADTHFPINAQEVRIAVSVGVGLFTPGIGQSADSVVSIADQSCYLAKNRGGNQVAALDADVEQKTSAEVTDVHSPRCRLHD